MNEHSVETGGARLVHDAIAVSSRRRADELFGELLGMEVVKTFEVGEDLARALFGRAARLDVVVYDGITGAVEVFIDPAMRPRDGQWDHLCLAVRDVAGWLRRAAARGMEVRRFPKGDREIVFVRDRDGNLYEIKERP